MVLKGAVDLDLRVRTFFPALARGLSPLPPPAMTPMAARQSGLNSLMTPEGICTMTFSPLETTVALDPAVFTNLPPSPGLASMLLTRVPSGILASTEMFPAAMTSPPMRMVCPTLVPSTASW